MDSQVRDDMNPINEMRVVVNPIYQSIRNLSFDENYEQVQKEIESNQDGIMVTLVDLSGQILLTTNNSLEVGQVLFLEEALYLDNSYTQGASMSSDNSVGTTKSEDLSEGSRYKLALPLYLEEIVDGFVIFEVDSKLIISANMDVYIKAKGYIQIGLIVLFIVFIIYTGILLFSKPQNNLDDLILGLENIGKGLLEPISIHKEKGYQDLYITYNILVEELGYIMKQQSLYDIKRKEFLTVLSHELKTPIATINAYVEGLIGGVAKDESEQIKYQNIIHQKMQQLTTQIEELFKYAQEESGKFKYNFEECYADTLFEDIFNNLVNHKGLKTEVENLIPKCIIKVDKIRIEQVLLNLYNNALKHSSSSMGLKLYSYRQDQNIVIEVTDFGEGIEPSDMPHIFDYYYQGNTSKEKDYEGIGLGLAICKDIISSHQGIIKVKSIVGEGTTFIIELPIV